MAASPPAHVPPEVLRWARESIGYSLEEAAQKIGVRAEKLADAEQGERLLTLRQAEKAAKFYERPLAALFAPEPPHEEPQRAQFRRLPGAPEPPWPPEMVSLARRVRARQDAAAELYDVTDERAPWPEARQELAKGTRQQAAQKARRILGISVEEQASWRDTNGYTPLRHWTDAVEELGVLVMQDGTLPMELARGFASIHEVAPAVVVNTQDDPRARAFTILHELGHLILAQRGEADDENWCNEFAGRVLMPDDALKAALEALGHLGGLRRFDEVALGFGVTPYAAVVRAARARLIDQQTADEVAEEIDARFAAAPPRSPGGDYYWTEIGRLGPSYIRLVFSALESQAVTYPAASSLLGVKVSNFEKLRGYIDRRGALA